MMSRRLLATNVARQADVLCYVNLLNKRDRIQILDLNCIEKLIIVAVPSLVEMLHA